MSDKEERYVSFPKVKTEMPELLASGLALTDPKDLYIIDTIAKAIRGSSNAAFLPGYSHDGPDRLSGVLCSINRE